MSLASTLWCIIPGYTGHRPPNSDLPLPALPLHTGGKDAAGAPVLQGTISM